MRMGPIAVTAWLLVEQCERLGLARQAALCAFLGDDWHVARSARYGSRDVRRLHLLFDSVAAAGNREHAKIRCSASELLALYGLLQFWIATEVPPDARLDEARRCYDRACHAVDLILQVKRRLVKGSDVSAQVTAAMAEHLALFTRCFGADRVKPKHHWAFDVAEQLPEHGLHLMDAFVVERLHLRARSVADHVSNTKVFEQALCTGLLNAQSHALQGDRVTLGLVGKCLRTDVGDIPQALVADAMRIGGRYIEVDAVVASARSHVGIVRACMEHEGQLFALVTPLAISRHVAKAVLCEATGGRELQLWRAADTEPCLAWKRCCRSGAYTVVTP